MAPSPSSPYPLDQQQHTFDSIAPFRYYPKQALVSVEYPGPVSHPSALLKVITQNSINECFNAPIAEQRILEMSYKRDDRNGVPVKGMRVPSQKLLLKICKKRRKRTDAMDIDGDAPRGGKGKTRDMSGVEGVFTAEIVGPLTQTVRFRGPRATFCRPLLIDGLSIGSYGRLALHS